VTSPARLDLFADPVVFETVLRPGQLGFFVEVVEAHQRGEIDEQQRYQLLATHIEAIVREQARQ
jgi:hypothetical protein